ncbi:MAG: pseudouridine synthase, partial [Spongiibacteraceae bacterium]
QQISDPRFKMPKTYWVQVEGDISDEAISQLQRGVTLKDGPTKPAKARRLIDNPQLWARNPPVRFRANIPTSWIELEISEGRNRQVRRMTAAVGFPTLRLVRAAIGEWPLADLQPGEHRIESLTADHPLMKAQRDRPSAPRRNTHSKQRKPGSTRRNTRS